MFPSLSTVSAIQALFIVSSLARPWAEPANSPFKSTTGFSNPTFSTSAGGFADCISGHINLPITSPSTKLLITEPKDQYSLTATFFDFLKANSSLATTINGGPSTVSGNFNIAAKLCYPKNWSCESGNATVQFLTHGIGFNQSYWDFAEGYSFIDVAAKAGYPTFSFDRLGVGASDHPDPIQVVQARIQVQIIHSLVSLLRASKLANQAFKNVIGVGHSFGSIQSVGLLSIYPKDFDAVVLTGFSTSSLAIPLTFADFNSAIANQNQPARFAGLPNGYLVVDNAIGDQTAFYAYPNFDPALFLNADTHKQTFTLGEFFTLTSIIAPSPNFTGPVDAVIGEFDFIFAQGNASYPTDQAALVQPALFPGARREGSRSLIVGGAGHAINLHFEAQEMFGHVQGFVGGNGF
ncbi:catalytic protein [Mollisia scopiformis]|uniref:Catalytic protein n=1 Tax=Mollisia scopiformis TaxID=149040 RepID=A0A194X0W4_MOLSC|nr:catalytic protein [Mollisia scopiformis]KUJ13838.1 catalytic protein [Mollisia scopiformis]